MVHGRDARLICVNDLQQTNTARYNEDGDIKATVFPS